MSLFNQIIKRPQPAPHPQLVAEKVSGSVLMEWGAQSGYYSEWWDWYDSNKLTITLSETSTQMKFPLRINPVRWVCNIHGRRMYGEFPDDSGLPVEFAFRNTEGKLDDECDQAARIVNRIWRESNGAELMLENGVVSQVLGGCVYRVAWQPENKRLSTGIRVMKVMPDYFLPVWDSEDPWYFKEVYILNYISGDEAKLKYGVDVHAQPWVLYSEHWTEDAYEIEVDGKTPKGAEYKGSNPFEVVPFVYIPHLTRAGGTYGQSHVPGLIGLIEEFNSRMADRGDGVKNAMFDRPILRNSSGKIHVRTLGEETQYVDIGTGVPGSTHEPDLFYLEPSSVKGAAISKDFTDDVWQLICNDSDTPPILWGYDDVALRSAMSMETLAGPYASHARAERIMNRTGLAIVNQFILKMALVKGAEGVTESMLELEPRVRWAKLMPRDRMEQVQEMVQRKQVELVSTRNAVTQLAQGEDIDEELELIEEDRQTLQDMQMKQADMQVEQQAQHADQQNDADKDKMRMQQEHQMNIETLKQNTAENIARQNRMRNAKKANPRQSRRE